MSGLAEDDLDETPAQVWSKRIGIVLLVVALIAGGWLMLSKLLSGKVGGKKPVTTVKLLPDTPPPPPPPPKEPPKEQPKEQPKEIKMEQPKPVETPQPPAEALKMEGAAGDGPSPFGAGTVNNEYKGGAVNTKIGGTGSGSAKRQQYNWFAGLIESKIHEALAKDPKLSVGSYKVLLNIWLTPEGKIQEYKLAGSSGDAETDDRIKAVMDALPPLTEPPPEDMPQPVKLRMTARSAS